VQATPRRIPFGLRRMTIGNTRGEIVGWRNGPLPEDEIRSSAVMVNGLAETKDRWAAVLKKVEAAGYDACSYDHLGQFESGGPDDPAHYAVAAMADDLLAVLDAMSPDRPVHVVGNCFGGFVARHLVRRRPDRIRSLVLLGSGLSLATSAASTMPEDVAAVLAAGGGVAELFDGAIEEALKDGISRRTADLVRDTYLETRAGFVAGFTDSVARDAEDGEDAAETTAIAVPLLVAYGSVDRMWAPAAQLAMAEHLGAPTEVIEGAGHSTTVTHPNATVDVLTRFWRSVEDRL
jgi:pimeloyl-ACP methyl ester carboxylesterase